MADITPKDLLNEKALDIILNFSPSDKYDRATISELLKLKNDLQKLINSLPEKNVLELKYFQNYTDDKIAEKLGKSKEEVIKSLSKGIDNLKVKIKEGKLPLENIKNVIELPKINLGQKPETKSTSKTDNVVSIPAQNKTVAKKVKGRPPLSGMPFFILFLCLSYFIVQRFFIPTLPSFKEIYSNITVTNKISSNKNKLQNDSNSYEIKISGSSSLFGLARRLENAFVTEFPEYKVRVISFDSSEGIKKLINGETDIANSSRPLSYLDKKRAAEKGIELIENRVALDALVIVVNSKNPFKELSLDDLTKIFTGEVKNWKDLNPLVDFSENIFPLVREKGSGTNDFVISRILEYEDFPRKITRKDSNTEIIKYISANPSAIGFVNSTNYPWENTSVKFLKIKNYEDSSSVSPFSGNELDKDAIRYGDYPLAHYLYLITTNSPSDKVKDFILWILSETGQSVVKHSGLVNIEIEES